MPASQEVSVHRDWVTAKVRPAEPDRNIYFTDESPDFVLSVTNHMEKDLSEDSKLNWSLGVGEGIPNPFVEHEVSISVDAGETTEYTIRGELLGFEGHGVIGISGGGMKSPNSESPTLDPGKPSSRPPALSFSVWDREHYEIVHEQPRQTQNLALATSIAVVILAFVQLATALGEPIFGTVVAAIVVVWYGWTGRFSELIDSAT